MLEEMIEKEPAMLPKRVQIVLDASDKAQRFVEQIDDLLAEAFATLQNARQEVEQDSGDVLNVLFTRLFASDMTILKALHRATETAIECLEYNHRAVRQRAQVE